MKSSRPSLECGPATMATVIANVTNCRLFWREIVVPDYNDFYATIDNIRRAFHCAISLFHLCDFFFFFFFHCYVHLLRSVILFRIPLIPISRVCAALQQIVHHTTKSAARFAGVCRCRMHRNSRSHTSCHLECENRMQRTARSGNKSKPGRDALKIIIARPALARNLLIEKIRLFT